MVSGDITSFDSNVVDRGTFLYKVGRIVLLNIRAEASVNLSPEIPQQIFTLPIGFVPIGYCRFSSTIAGNVLGEIVIESNGEVKFNAAIASKKIADGTMCIFITS